MSREGGHGRIDSIKNSLNTDYYHRTGLGNAVRFNAALNLAADVLASEIEGIVDESTGRFSGLAGRVSRDEFARALDEDLESMREDFNRTIEEELGLVDDRFDTEETIQQRLANSAYRSRLGSSVARATVENIGMYQDTNSPFNSGATGAFRSFTNGFVQGDSDAFGSRVLYDNVFGQYEDGGESLTMQRRRTISDPTNDMNRTVGDKVLDDVVNRSIYDQTEIIDRVDTEYARFFGDSMVDQYSMSGSGLKAARQTIREVMLEGSAYGRQLADRGNAEHPVEFAQALINRAGQDNVSAEITEVQNSLTLLDNNLKNRSGQSVGVDGGYVNKAGVAQFIDLINTAGTRSENGELIGGHIAISSFQFQNEAISAALTDKIQRHVLESVLQGGTGKPLQVDMTLAYPRQRALNDKNSEDTRYGIGSTNYSILGPNLIEALKLEEVKNDIFDMLRGMGVVEDDLEQYLKVNIQFRDKKFHPKVYLTDNVAGIGTQNLTGPVGNSVNQAGSNFETMRFVANKYKDDEQLEQVRKEFVPASRSENKMSANNSLKNGDITQSLLYRQIVNAVEYEQNFTSETGVSRAGGNTAAPIVNNRRGQQVGFAGDIYQHLRNTLNYAYETNFNIVEGPQKGGIRKEVAGQNTTHMFMVLDQAFMLQMGSGATTKLLKGEMGAETGTPFGERDEQFKQYRDQQSKLFDLLIANKASVVVDAKNYREQVMNPLIEKINKNEKLKSNFERNGKSLGLMAGYDLFDPGSAATPEEYTASMKAMRRELVRLGFTQEAGFNDTDLKQIIGLASGNIEMAKAPRQHVKSFGLMDYRQGGSPELISYYMGSSNLGLYSLGIPTGEAGGYRATDGDLTNTEMGIMLGRRDMADGANLSRVQEQSARMSEGSMSDPTDINGIKRADASSMDQWSLNQEEERYELMLAQRHLVHTWSQLGNSTMDNPNFQAVNTVPLWQNNVNTGDLQILKGRLENMATDLGIDPHASRSAFQIVERYGQVSGSGVTSINVTIDMAQMLGSNGFLKSTANLPKLNFELTVLQGPSRGSGMFNDRTQNGEVPGFVYFVDKNKVVGNGLFSNDTGKSIEVLGRRSYEDDFIADTTKGKGRIELESGESAYMSSLDIVPQLFATIMGEGVKRFGAEAGVEALSQIRKDDALYRNTLTDFMSTLLSGAADQMDESGDRPTIFTSRELLLKDLHFTSGQDLIGKVIKAASSKEDRADFTESGESPLERREERKRLAKSLQKFSKEVNTILGMAERDKRAIDDRDLDKIIDSLSKVVFGGEVAPGVDFEGSGQLANFIMKTVGKDKKEAEKIQEFKEFQTLMFGSFLQARDDRTYAGQQGFYKTLLMGLGDSTIDRKSANLMFSLDEDNQGLHNLGAYARFKPLEYTPTTDIHQVLYRSVASKSTSMTKNDPGLDSMLFESEARDLGDAANLRLLSSMGIGTVMQRDNYIIKDSDGNTQVGKDQQEIFNAMEAAGVDRNALAKARQEYVRAASAQFGDLNSNERGDTVRLQFYTGSDKKLSQLPQRIKNAMGSRPLYQYSVEAQMALAEGESLNQMTDSYIKRNRDPLKTSIKKKVIELQDRLEDIVKAGGTEEQIEKVSNQLEDLKTIGTKAFATETDGLGAVFSGKIKSVLNQEQISFIENTRARLYEAMEELIKEGDVSESQMNELLRVEVMKAGLVNKGLGKMIAGSNHMNYSMSVIQLTGTYNDTFLANSLYGTTYKSRTAYETIRDTETDIYALNQDQLRDAGVMNVGMTEGYFETQQKSIKGSMMGEGGIEVLLQKGDVIVEDPETGHFVQKRKVNNKWYIVNAVDKNRNLDTVRNEIDNTAFSDVGSPTLGSAPTTSYGRRGEESVDYIYSVNSRPGNFQNNEYLLQFNRLRSIKPGSGRRVEGTDSASLVKGVAFFAGRIKKEYNGQEHNINVFEDIERQYVENYKLGEVGGSLKAYLDYSDQTQRVKLNDGREVYAPLSSSIQGVFNANNFKSFFWSHGATMLRAQTENEEGRHHFMLDELFSTKADHNVTNAKKLAGALLLTFGTDFIAVNETDTVTKNTEVNKIKSAMVEGMLKGEYGSYHQKLALATGMQLKTSEINEINKQVTSEGKDRAELTSQLLFDKISKNSGYNGVALAGLAGISSDQLRAVLNGDGDEATRLLKLVREGMIDPVANKAVDSGGINFDNSTHRGAAIITTAVDLMHQLSRSGSKLQLPSDIDMESDKVKEVLFTVMGLGGEADDQYKNDIMEFIGTMNTDVSAVTVFTDITFSFSKDPVGTQSVGRHEAQHLITPFTGQLEKYKEGGQLDKIQHTVAGLQALVAGKKSGWLFRSQMADSGFAQKSALNLASAETDFMFSTFHKQKFLGFYQQGTAGIATDNLVKEYKNINAELARDNSQYNWSRLNIVRDIADPSKISKVIPDGEAITNRTGVSEALALVDRHIDKFYPNVDPVERARLQDKFLRMGGQAFAVYQMDELVNQMSIHNARFQSDPRKTKGKDTTSQFLQNMQNKQMFVSIPDLDFSQQNGEIVARTDRKRTISTIIPSADDMRVLGAQYADFVDPILGHYKHLSAIFVPGTEENRIFEKVRLATQNNEPLVLSTAEFQVYKKIQDSATLMPTELAKGIAGARTQEAFAGKNKYQGFTSTAIGSLLMPFGSAALAQAKLDEAGMRNEKAKMEAFTENERRLREMNRNLQRRFTDKERLFIQLHDKFGSPNAHNNGEFQRTLETTKHWEEARQLKGLGNLQSTMSSLNRLRKQGFAAQRHNLSNRAQVGNIVSTLNELQRLHDQLDRIKESKLEAEATRQTVSMLQQEVVQYQKYVFEQGEKHFGLKRFKASDVLTEGDPGWMRDKGLGVYDPSDERIAIQSGAEARLEVYGIYDVGTSQVRRAGEMTGEYALPIIKVHKDTVMGYIYEDEEGEELLIQRAGFQAKYGGGRLPDYQDDMTATDIAIQRPFDIATTDKPRATRHLYLKERQAAAKVENLVMQELEAKYPGSYRQEKRRKRDILGAIEKRIEVTEDRSKLKTISEYLGGLAGRREDIDTGRVTSLQQRIDIKRSTFDAGEMFGPPLPAPKLKTIDTDPRADLTRDTQKPQAWELRDTQRQQILQETRRRILAADSEEKLGALADIIESKIDSTRPGLQGPLQRILDEDIPSALNRLKNDIWATTKVDRVFKAPDTYQPRLMPARDTGPEIIDRVSPIEEARKQFGKATSLEESMRIKRELEDKVYDSADYTLEDELEKFFVEELPEINNKIFETSQDKTEYRKKISTYLSNASTADGHKYLMGLAKELGADVVYKDTLIDDALGTARVTPKGKTIKLSNKIKSEEKLSVLAHELLHILQEDFGMPKLSDDRVIPSLKRINQVNSHEAVAHSLNRVFTNLRIGEESRDFYYGEEAQMSQADWVRNFFGFIVTKDFDNLEKFSSKYGITPGFEGDKFSDTKYIFPNLSSNQTFRMIQPDSEGLKWFRQFLEVSTGSDEEILDFVKKHGFARTLTEEAKKTYAPDFVFGKRISEFRNLLEIDAAPVEEPKAIVKEPETPPKTLNERGQKAPDPWLSSDSEIVEFKKGAFTDEQSSKLPSQKLLPPSKITTPEATPVVSKKPSKKVEGPVEIKAPSAEIVSDQKVMEQTRTIMSEETQSSQPPIKPPSNTITSVAPEPPERPDKNIPKTNDPAQSATRIQYNTRAEEVVGETFKTRYQAEPREVVQHKSLVDNIRSFRRKQGVALSLGITKGLEVEFDRMKREAIETKNKLAAYRDSNFLTEDEKRAAFNELKQEFLDKRNAAYAMANISPETGKEIGIDPETGLELVNKPGFEQRRPSLNDSYLYHAQALNYDQLVTQIMLLGNAEGTEELSKEHVKELQRRSTFIRKEGSFALNSYEDGDGRSTFFGLSHQEVGFDTRTLFVIENSDSDGGSVERHMKAINDITTEAKTLGMDEVAKSMAADYAKQQIDAQIAMYKNRAAEMRKFSQEREAHSGKRDSQGNLIIDESTRKKIDEAHSDYDKNTQDIITFLEQQKSKIANGAKGGQIRTIFEDIDVMVSYTDKANLQIAEVFRPPTPGGTDPRLHTYRVMQGVMALNKVSKSLQETSPTNRGSLEKDVKMIYSTERGQTATVMASLGIVTYGGGDWDGDSYTAIFHQAEEIQSAIQKHSSEMNRHKLLIRAAKKEIHSLKAEMRGIDPSHPNFKAKSARLSQLEATIQTRTANFKGAKDEFDAAKQDMEMRIQSGYRGLTARARRQISQYTGIDERHFVSQDEEMYDVNGKVIVDVDGNAVTGLRQGATMDADALFVQMEQGYGLMEKVDSKRNQVIGMMNNIDALTGYRTNPEAFDDSGFLQKLATGIAADRKGGALTAESPSVGMLKNRATSLLVNNQELDDNQRVFLSTLADSDDATAFAWLQEFDKLTRDMGMQDADEAQHNRQQVEAIRDAQSRRARMNRWIADDLFNPMMANETVGKFMQQGMGMTLTEGTFDITLKALGKAGGEVLGKTYNTIIGSTFADSPVITYGTQIADEKSELYHSTLNEFQKQAERRLSAESGMSPEKAQIIEDGKERGLSGKKLDNYVATQIRKVGYDEFRSYRDQAMSAVEKSNDVQGFMKNIHQLMRDSIKLKGDTDNLLAELDEASKQYDDLSKQMSEAEDEDTRLEHKQQRDRIIDGMASKLGPGPGLKSLINLDYLTNESNKTGLSINDFETRFFEGSGNVMQNKERLLAMGASLSLSSDEMAELRGLDNETTKESAALLNIARGQTARNLGAMVTSYQMARVAGDGRSQQLKELAVTQKARLATQIEAHVVPGMPTNRSADGQIDVSGVIDNRYTNVILQEHEGAKFDANRQHKEALGAHMGLKESQIFNDDGQLTDEYRSQLTKSASDMGVSQEEYLLAYDHLMENNREVIGGIFGNDGQKMKEFTTMNMMRKNLAQSMLTGRTPAEDGAKIIDESMSGEVMTTMAQLAAQGKLDSQGMEVFSGMYKGVMRTLIDATGHEIDAYNPKTGQWEKHSYDKLDAKSKNAVLTKLTYENLFNTQSSDGQGFSRATSDEAREFKTRTGQLIAGSKMEVRVAEDGSFTLGNDFIDALNKSGEGSSTEAQKDAYEAMGEEYLRETLDNEEMSDMLLRQFLNADGIDPNSKQADSYRKQIATSVKAQMRHRQEQMTKSNAYSRSKHGRGYGVQSRSSFMNNMNGDIIGQLTKDSRANALDLVMPLILTAAGTAMSEGNIGGDDIMALGGAAFTSFQYARTGVIDHADLSKGESKKRLAAAQASSGIFKLKNAMMQHGDENIGQAIAQVALSEAVSVGFNMAVAPKLSQKIAGGLGAGAAPAMNAMDMRKYTAGQQLSGNIAASAISAVSSTLISGIIINTMQGNGPSISETIQSFMPAAQAVSQVNEAIARRRAQEAAFEDFQAETNGTDDNIQEYMVVTDATYNPDDYSSIADLAASQEIEPGSDGSLSVGLIG